MLLLPFTGKLKSINQSKYFSVSVSTKHFLFLGCFFFFRLALMVTYSIAWVITAPVVAFIAKDGHEEFMQ